MHNTDRTQQFLESNEYNPGLLAQGEYQGEFQGEYPQELQGEYQPEYQGEYQPEYQGEYQPELQAEGEFPGELINPVTGEVNPETELALAAELLAASNEEELNYFLGKLLGGIGRTFKKVASSGIGRTIGGLVKTVAKAALPMVGGAVGSLIPIPGVGTALGAAAGNALGGALGLEGEGLSNEDRDFEVARRIVRIGIEGARALERMPESEFMSQQELGNILGGIASRVLPSIGSAVLSGLTGQAASGGQATGGLSGGVQVSSPGGWNVRLGGQAGGQVTGGTALGVNTPAPGVPFQPSAPGQVLPYRPGVTQRPIGAGGVAHRHHKVGRWIRQGRNLVVLNAF